MARQVLNTYTYVLEYGYRAVVYSSGEAPSFGTGVLVAFLVIRPCATGQLSIGSVFIYPE